MILTDESPMPFGKFQGDKMANVPASYLLWIFKENKCADLVAQYIEDNMDVLKQEAKK